MFNFPHQIRYLNLDHRTERDEYMRSQFKKYGLTNTKRVSASIFSEEKISGLKGNFLESHFKTQPRYMSVLVNRAEMIKDFLNDEDEDVCMMIEDDLSFLTTKYWNFDWFEFYEKLPKNWDCVQLHIIGEKYVPLKLVPWTRNNHSAACILITKRYAEKFVDMFFDNGWNFSHNYGYQDIGYHVHSGDFIPYQVGVTYSFPLFITNSKFISDGYVKHENLMARKSDATVLKWWKTNKKPIHQLMCLN